MRNLMDRKGKEEFEEILREIAKVEKNKTLNSSDDYSQEEMINILKTIYLAIYTAASEIHGEGDQG